MKSLILSLFVIIVLMVFAGAYFNLDETLDFTPRMAGYVVLIAFFLIIGIKQVKGDKLLTLGLFILAFLATILAMVFDIENY